MRGAGRLPSLGARSRGSARDGAKPTRRAVNPPFEFVLFGLTLLGIAVWHRHNLFIALGGLVAIALYQGLVLDQPVARELLHEWKLVLNLFGLLVGFAILARHFEDSGIPDRLPAWLPDDWRGGFVLLFLVALISTFLDNIAAAVLGGVVARRLYDGRVGVAYLAAIVAASNAGGAGSVIGDTTTTMMWLAGVPAAQVAEAFIGAAVSLAFIAYWASRAQQRLQPIRRDNAPVTHLDARELEVMGVLVASRVVLAAGIVGGAVAGNVLVDFPALGAWAAILAGRWFHPVPWGSARQSLPGALFLLALVLAASLMPVARLPEASWHSALGLGFISAVFDNIPLTALALSQGGYDWGVLAFAVGVGGSMIWFGSSAGVALATHFPAAQNTLRWLREAWFVPVGFVLGFAALLALTGWHPLRL